MRKFIPILFVLFTVEMAAAQMSCRSVLTKQDVAGVNKKTAFSLDAFAREINKDGEYATHVEEIVFLKQRISQLEYQKQNIEALVQEIPSYQGNFGKRREYSRLEYDISALKRKLGVVQKDLEDEGYSAGPSSRKISKLDNEIRFLENNLEDHKYIRDEAVPLNRLYYGKKGVHDGPVRRLEDEIEQVRSQKSEALARGRGKSFDVDPELRKEHKSLRIELKTKTKELAALKKAIDAGRAEEKKKAAKDLKEVVSQLEQIKDDLALSYEKFKSVKETERTRLIKVLSDLETDPRMGAVVKDRVEYYAVSKIPKDQKVTILIGDMSQVSAKQKKKLITLIEVAMERGYYIVYDASSKSANFMAEITQEFGIGVLSSSKTKFQSIDGGQVVVGNKYLRMKLFGESAAIIASPESAMASDMIKFGLLSHVLDTSKKFEVEDFGDWLTPEKKTWYQGMPFRDPRIAFNADGITTPDNNMYYGGDGKRLAFDGLPEVTSEILGFEVLGLKDLELRDLQEIPRQIIVSQSYPQPK